MEPGPELTDLSVQHQDETRLLTILFADLTSSVGTTAGMDPEETATFLDRVLAVMAQAVAEHDGRIESYLGDGILAFFGTPRAHEDDPARAILAALQIRQRLQAMGLDATAGIETGEVFLGRVGSTVHQEFGARGHVINLAARLQAKAEPGQILVGAATHRLARDEFETRLRHFREEVDAELRRRAAEQRGAEAVARSSVRALPEDLDFFQISADEQDALRRRVHTLARKLATRLAAKRRSGRTGRLDARRTMRASLGTGGAPVNPVFRSRRIHRPELVVLTDVSGSVAAFARFTLMFCHALQGQVSKVRSFAFIDTVDEVTALFAGGDFAAAVSRMAADAKVVWLDGHSDYGHAFTQFHARFHDAVGPRSTVLVLGDARNNYRAANTWVLAELRRRARRVYWLNPEPRAQWDSGDSIASEYAPHVERMVECRNLRQLSAFIESIA
jgi:uncharacterized protein with von Willebrand factor type A (vWA) domain